MMTKRFKQISLASLAVLGVFLWAGGAWPQTLAQVIEGAKKEGAVAARIKSGVTPKSIERLESEIKKKFDVELRIKFAPSSNMPQDLSEIMMENKVGVSPSYDILNMMSSHVTAGIKAGVLEKVNWEPLLTKGTHRKALIGIPPHDERLYGYGVTYYTGRMGVMYNPKKVSAHELPKTLSALADPKWEGKVAIFNYPNAWTRLAFVGGKDKVLSDLRAILKNGAIQGRYVDEYSRYLLGEVWLVYLSTAYLKMAWDKGVEAGWHGIDPVDVQHFSLALTKGARHPNAARLLVSYLASPEGAKFMLEEGGAGNYLYPGNFEYDLHQREVKQGLRHVSAEESHIVEFEISEEYTKWEKEIILILQTGGK